MGVGRKKDVESDDIRRGGRRRRGGVGRERRNNRIEEAANREVEASVGGVGKDMNTKCKNGEKK